MNSDTRNRLERIAGNLETFGTIDLRDAIWLMAELRTALKENERLKKRLGYDRCDPIEHL